MMRPRENACGLAETFVYARQGAPAHRSGSARAARTRSTGTASEVLHDARLPQPSPTAASVMVRRARRREPLAGEGVRHELGLGLSTCASATPTARRAKSCASRPTPPTTLPASRRGHDAKVQTCAAAPHRAARRVSKPRSKTARPSADAVANLARYLQQTGSDDPGRAPRQAARRARGGMAPTRREPAARRAARRRARRDDALRAQGRDAVPGRSRLADPARATCSPLVRHPSKRCRCSSASSPTRDEWLDAQQLKANLLRDLELPAAAVHVLEAAIARVGETPELLRALADIDNATGQQDAVGRRAPEGARAALRRRRARAAC